MELKKLKQFFDQRGINKRGICEQAGISQQHLNAVLRGERPLTENLMEKLTKVIKKYGY